MRSLSPPLQVSSNLQVMDNTRNPWERELTPALWCSSDETRRVAYALSDCGKKIIASISVSTHRSDPPPVFQTRSRRSSWPWGSRLDRLDYSTPSRHDPGDSEYGEWLDAAARAGAHVDVAVAHGWLGSLGLEPMSVWMPRATPAQYSDYWLLVIHAMSWNECIPTTTTIQWTVESANPLHVSCTSSIAGPISTASLESWSHILEVLRRHDDAQERPIPRRLTPLTEPEAIASACRNGRLVERELRWNAVREDDLVLDCALVEDPRYRPPEEAVGERESSANQVAEPHTEDVDPAQDVDSQLNVRDVSVHDPEVGDASVPAQVSNAERVETDLEFRIDNDNFTVSYRGRTCSLGRTKPFEVLKHLRSMHNTLVSTDALRSAVWSGEKRSDEVVYQAVSRLRAQLKSAGLDKWVEISNAKSGYLLRLNREL